MHSSVSDGRLNILGYYYLCPTSMGSMSYERTQYPLRYCFHWCTIRESYFVTMKRLLPTDIHRILAPVTDQVLDLVQVYINMLLA